MNDFKIGDICLLGNGEVTVIDAPPGHRPNNAFNMWVQFVDGRACMPHVHNLRHKRTTEDLDRIVEIGSLRLTVQDADDYRAQCAAKEHAKQVAISCQDHRTAKRCRQAQNDLYNSFLSKSIPRPVTAYEREQALTVEQRLERIEQHLKLGNWSEE